MKALEYGAVEIIEKPRLGTKRQIKESCAKICDIVKAASLVRVKRVPTKTGKVSTKLTADAIITKPVKKPTFNTTEKVVVIGASAGGVGALRSLLEAVPSASPGIVIVQHMPEGFTSSFAGQLDSYCRVSVKEAVNNDTVVRGQVLIAPGNSHVLLKLSGDRYFVEVKGGPFVCRHRPSVDVLFRSAARYAGKNAVGVIMIGMGDDGAKGMLEMKEAGATNIAQDESTSVVFGMPSEAINLGAIHQVLPLDKIPEEMLKMCNFQ